MDSFEGGEGLEELAAFRVGGDLGGSLVEVSGVPLDVCCEFKDVVGVDFEFHGEMLQRLCLRVRCPDVSQGIICPDIESGQPGLRGSGRIGGYGVRADRPAAG